MTNLANVSQKSDRSAAQILTEMSDFLIGTVEVEEAMTFALAQLLDYLGGSLCIELSTLENEGQELWVRAQCYSSDRSTVFGEVGSRYNLAGLPGSQRVIENGRFLHIPDFDHLPFPPEVQINLAMTVGMKSILYVPLLARSRSIGILHVEVWQVEREFTEAEIQLCQGVANLVAVAIQNGRLLAAERKQLLLAQTLQKVGALLTSQLSLDELYDQLFQSLADVVTYDSVSIQIVDKKTNYVHLVASKGFDFSIIDKVTLDAIAQRSLHKFKPDQYVRTIPDTQEDNQWISLGLSSREIRSWIGVLLRVKGQVIGILNVDSSKPHAFNMEDSDLVVAFANQAAIAIENTRLYKETDRRATELSILHQMALDTASIVDLDELFTSVTNMIVATLYPESFGFTLVDQRRDQITPHSSYHGLPSAFLSQSFPITSSVCGSVVETGLPLLVADMRKASRFAVAGADMLSKVAVPIKIDDEVMGVINAESRHLAAFSQNDVVFLTTLAGLISASIDRSQMVQQLRAYSENLEREVARQTAALKLERDRTTTILEHAGESILLLDSNAEITYINPATTLQSGYANEQLMGKTLLYLESNLTAVAVYAELRQKLMSGQPWTGQLINKRQDGSFYDVAMTMAPITAVSGEVTGFVVVEADITRLKEIERLKTEFVANVTHELRTPLTNIKTYISLAQRGREDKKERYFQILNHETDRLAQLIQDLLDLSHLETEAPLQYVIPVNLGKIVSEYVDIFQAKAALKAIKLVQIIPEGITAVAIEDRHVGQLLTNLLGNAIAYTPEGGQVVVTVGQSETAVPPQVWFQIADSGNGIPVEELPHLFDRFYRGSYSQNKGIPGTGLGLAICQGIANRYHGNIEIESKPGQGATVTVSLPAVRLPKDLSLS